MSMFCNHRRYHDGYQAEGLTSKDVEMTRLFYPAFWLKATGYFDSKINSGPDVIMFTPSPFSGFTWAWFAALFFTAVFSSVLSLSVAYMLMDKRAPVAKHAVSVDVPLYFNLAAITPSRNGYTSINV